MTAQEQAAGVSATGRGQLVLIGVAPVAAFACVLVAALPPSLRPIYTSPAGLGAVIAIGHHLMLWKVAISAFALGIGIELAGLAGLAALTARMPSALTLAALALAALALFALAAAMWVVNLVFRLTVTVSVAAAAGRGSRPGTRTSGLSPTTDCSMRSPSPGEWP